MRRFAMIWGATALVCAQSVAAQSFENCTKAEVGMIKVAVDRAKHLTLHAAAVVGPTPTYARWFGPYTPKQGETVRNTLKSVVAAIRTGEVSAVCVNVGEDICDHDTYAFVSPAEAYVISYCPLFFEMPTMKQLSPSRVRSGHGTRAGTVIHELTHFDVVAGTDDFCYSRDDCSLMTAEAQQDALMNADSYQYFVEDVEYFKWHTD